jgi:DNA-binding transcriptional LysR family regulator
LTIEIRHESSCDLLAAHDRGELDAVIIRREDDRRDGEVLAPEHFGWFATPDFTFGSGEPLRLASSSPSCGIRNLSIRALDEAGIPWAETFLGCGSFGVADAVSAGLAAAVLSRTLAPRGSIDVGARFGLPAIPSSEIILLSSLSDRNSRAILKTLAASFREHRDMTPLGSAA